MRNDTRRLFNAWHEDQVISAFSDNIHLVKKTKFAEEERKNEEERFLYKIIAMLEGSNSENNFSAVNKPEDKPAYSTMGECFTISPSAQVTIAKRLQESADFLSKINIIDVIDKSGQKVCINSDKPTASTTDTSVSDRTPSNYDEELINEYNCTQTNYDVAIPYSKIDTYASQDNFRELLDDAVIKRQALDKIMIGFNGTSRAATSNREINPLLQDVNKGWLQKIREQNPNNCIKEILPGSNKIKIGFGVDMTEGYGNIDALVIDLINNALPIEIQDDPNLVVILGRENISDKMMKLMNEYASTPSELLAMNTLLLSKKIGGLNAVSVPFFPSNTVLITRLDNLSIYYQLGSNRKLVVENPKRDRIEIYESVNESYVVETLEAAVMAENIVFTDK